MITMAGFVPFFRGLVALFFITTVYVYFTPVVYDYVKPYALSVSNNQAYQDVVSLIFVVWDNFILIAILVVLIYWFIQAMRREPDEAYG